MANKIMKYINKVIVFILTLFGITSLHSCGGKDEEIICMYGGPESFHKEIDSTDDISTDENSSTDDNTTDAADSDSIDSISFDD